MDTETLDCEKAKDEKDRDDNESLPEQCWVSTSKNDSRKWLIRDASYTLPKEPPASTTRTTYLYPQVRDETENIIGQRTKEMLRRFEEEAVQEIIKETSVDCTVDYCTEYDGNFNGSGFQVRDKVYEADQEIYKKYPLYSSTPTSFYSFKLSKDPRRLLAGHTLSNDPLQPFKKCAGFSKPMNDKLDNRIW
ncbi:unnamed protein product [Acanthoscelides obtectus]|uniref:Uncharacterized protein n=1 Tax=Acanthoscelides obtectus TaxID=200917 RepID=A0A9P0Q0W3_ACAOB|nr:unnamed protein product [Acanthoscelides obtectus]CAK1644072.1 hypothetical protein AOBTE_LOCUS13810 [Acanthoscelides obtectus]